MRRGILRVLDANLNRSREGLRVCEEVSRFILKSVPLTRDLKNIRHAITLIIKRMPSCSELLKPRDAKGDIGRCARLESRTRRRDVADIFLANMERAKESLRVLEEFSKLNDERMAEDFKALRFRLYDVEKRSLKKMPALRDPR